MRTGGLIIMKYQFTSKVGKLEKKKNLKKQDQEETDNKKKERISKFRKKSANKEGSKKNLHKIVYRISLRVQVLVGFVVPIILIIILGVNVYSTAQEGLIDNYKQGAEQTLQISSQLLDNELNHIEQSCMNLFLSDEVYYYCSGVYLEASYDSVQVINGIRDDILVKSVDPAIENIYIMPKATVKALSTQGTISDVDIYSRIGEDIASVRFGDEFGWAGSHPQIDEIWEQDNSGYILSCYIYPRNEKGILIVDVSSSLIQEIIENIHVPEGGSISFVTYDGRELNTGNENIVGFASEQFFLDAISSGNLQGSEMVEFQGESYLFMYHVGEVSDSIVAELVPESIIMNYANKIRSFVLIIVIFAILIVGVIGMCIAVGLDRKLGRLQRTLRKMAEGDLTVQVEGEGKTAFGNVNRDMTETIFGVKQLINKVKNVAQKVSGGVEDVEIATKDLSKSAADINSAIDEISEGTMQQANDAADCLVKMDELSERILSTSTSVDEVTKIADNTIERIQVGTEHMDQLIKKSMETGKLSEEVGEKVTALAGHSIQIESFVSQIEEIADSTNLLSLNASIEAARAGEAGKGFAVVANEIQKLSDNSLVASQKIAQLVKTILKMTDEAKKSTDKAVISISEQQESVSETAENFKEMNTAVLSLLNKLQDVTKEIQNMQKEREATLTGIENISSVSEETAAVSENVGNHATGQKELAEKLQLITIELKESTEVLMKEISLFTVE